jgi:hypothetical protein
MTTRLTGLAESGSSRTPASVFSYLFFCRTSFSASPSRGGGVPSLTETDLFPILSILYHLSASASTVLNVWIRIQSTARADIGELPI